MFIHSNVHNITQTLNFYCCVMLFYFLTNILLRKCPCVSFCLLFDNPGCCGIRFFFLSFLQQANFPRQTQRQKLPLFTQRAIVVKPAINPLKIMKKNLINFMQGLKSELHDNQPLFHESLFLKIILI